MCEKLCPQQVSLAFVRQYYTILNKGPLHLHRFYNDDSMFTHGGSSNVNDIIVGREDIHKKILSLNLIDCRTKIRNVDAHTTLGDGIVIQVTGELSSNGNPMRSFLQTFVLASKIPKKYYVHNDIFRYLDEVFIDEEDAAGGVTAGADCDATLQEETKQFSPSSVSSMSASTVNNSTSSGASSSAATVNGTAGAHHYETRCTAASFVASVNHHGEIVASVNHHGESTENFADHVTTTSQDCSWDKNDHEEFISSSWGEEEVVSDEGPRPTPPPPESRNLVNLLKGKQQQARESQDTQPRPLIINARAQSPLQEHPTASSDLGGNQRPGVSIKINAPRSYHNQYDNDRRRPSSSSASESPLYQVFVGNVPRGVSEDDLKTLFSKFGPVTEVRMNRSKPPAKAPPPHGNENTSFFAFVTFETEQAMLEAIKEKIVLFRDSRMHVEKKLSRGAPPQSGFHSGGSAGYGRGFRGGEMGGVGGRGGGGGYSRGGGRFMRDGGRGGRGFIARR